jgi:amino acid permease
LAPYNAYPGSKTPVIIYTAIFSLLLVVIFATPFCVLPTKDSIEDVCGIKADGRKLSKSQNLLATLFVLVTSCAVSIFVTSFGTIMTVLGATTNSAIGFLLPITFYLKCEKKAPTFSNKKCVAYLLFGFICCSSVIELTTFGIRCARGEAV